MKLTLRQARNLESRLKSTKIEHQIIEVRAYDVDAAREDIEEGKRNLRGEIEHKIKINEIRHEIKREINNINMQCGVAGLLNERDYLYEDKRLLSTLGHADTTDRQIAFIEDQDSDYRKVCVVREDMVDSASAELEYIDTRLGEIQEELNHLNNNVTFEYDATYLKECGLL